MPPKIMFCLSWDLQSDYYNGHAAAGITYEDFISSTPVTFNNVDNDDDDDDEKDDIFPSSTAHLTQKPNGGKKAARGSYSHDFIDMQVRRWRNQCRQQHPTYDPPYFAPCFYYNPIAFTLKPWSEIIVIFDRNDTLGYITVCDCMASPENQGSMVLSYVLHNFSTTTSVNIAAGTSLAHILDHASLIRSEIVPLPESKKYKDDDDDNDDDDMDVSLRRFETMSIIEHDDGFDEVD